MEPEMAGSESPPPEPPTPSGSGVGSVIQAVLALLLLIALLALPIAGAVWIISALAPDAVPQKREPGFIDNIFASPIVIAAARVVLLAAADVLLFAGLYIVASVLVRMVRREWLMRAGPFESELAEAARSLDEADSNLDNWLEALEENEELGRRLEEANEAIVSLLDERDHLADELTRLRQT
jgi:hypothetical protein